MWGVYTFPWESAVKKEETGEWTNIFRSPDGEMIVVEGLNVDVNDEGVVFNGENH